MNKNMAGILRGTRTVLQLAAGPLDHAVRLMNNKKGYPPLWLRQSSGDLSDFEGSGGEYLAYLKLLCMLEPGESLLDVGCGCGLMCLDVTGAGSLLDYVGEYYGLDTNDWVVDWCNRNLKRRNSWFQKMSPNKSFPFPCASKSFDVVLAKSLFTHLLPGETQTYLKEIKRVLRSGGRCLSTWFLLDERELRGKYTFKYWEGPVSCQRENNPRLAVAYKKNWVLDTLEGLKLGYEVIPGTWTGNKEGLSFQDIILIGEKDD